MDARCAAPASDRLGVAARSKVTGADVVGRVPLRLTIRLVPEPGERARSEVLLDAPDTLRQLNLS